MKTKIRNFFETGVILTILFALVIQGVATTESTLSEEILGFSDAEFEWVPVYGDGLHTIVGNEIVLHEVPQLVTLEIYVSGWSPNLLKALQATVDSAGYSNGVGGTLVPFGWPGLPEDGCFIDTSRPDYVFYGMIAIDAVHTGDLDYMWGATLLVSAKADDAQTYYLGTLIIYVPTTAEGAYLIDFSSGNTKTFMTDDMGQFILPLTLTPAFITIDDPSNNPPYAPVQPSGPTSGVVGESYFYTTSAIDPDDDDIRYGWDWDGDGIVDEYSNLMNSGNVDSRNHAWTSPGTYNVKVKAKDEHNALSGFSFPLTVTITSGANQPPNKPSTPSGTTSGKTGTQYGYSSNTIDPDGDDVFYMFDWDDGTNSGWLGPYISGDTVNAFKTWTAQGSYSVKVKAMDSNLEEGPWSDPLAISMPKNKATNTPFLQFLENHPHLFPLLRQLMEL